MDEYNHIHTLATYAHNVDRARLLNGTRAHNAQDVRGALMDDDDDGDDDVLRRRRDVCGGHDGDDDDDDDVAGVVRRIRSAGGDGVGGSVAGIFGGDGGGDGASDGGSDGGGGDGGAGDNDKTGDVVRGRAYVRGGDGAKKRAHVVGANRGEIDDGDDDDDDRVEIDDDEGEEADAAELYNATKAKKEKVWTRDQPNSAWWSQYR